ncbi:MAG: flagellar filament outer layer protein FlaA [Treponema sp.]|nr:flagellar filament outer layer protein FlaA [Treponema sp.]MCL2237298.1 flagellar filament outer layer protein FlaA [Treponema sp.]
MKHASFKIICLILWACIMSFSVYGQSYGQTTVAMESRILESFNGDDDSPYIWRTQASRFISVVRNESGEPVNDSNGNPQRFPLTSYVNAWPVAVFGYARAPDAPPIRSLGLRGQFDRRGYNWIDLYPTLRSDDAGTPAEIPIPGRVHNFDMWVWGANLRYYIELYVRDYRGVVHALRLGDIGYAGWRNLRVTVPGNITQSRRTLPSYAGLTFVKFRIWTQPVERVDNFYIYFKQLKILTDMFETLFDGNDLADPEHVDRLWASE